MSRPERVAVPSIEARKRLGSRLREARMYLGLKQGEVAQHLGIPRTTLSGIESGQRRIDAVELVRLAKLYELRVSYFTEEEPDTVETPDIAHLARQSINLSAHDRKELQRFANYLRFRSTDPEGD